MQEVGVGSAFEVRVGLKKKIGIISSVYREADERGGGGGGGGGVWCTFFSYIRCAEIISYVSFKTIVMILNCSFRERGDILYFAPKS